ncbi:MAG: TIGR00730 family Rossman fold protein [Gemmataceae bacterium]
MTESNGQRPPRAVCVFCGSSTGNRVEYTDAARALGRALSERGLTLVYGAGDIGLMGLLADAVLETGGRVIGVIPRALVDRELGHNGLTELHVVETMHQRKALMADRADAFLALPGGFGTGDELFEILTWAQLGIHTRPIGLVNVAGYFDPLLAWIDRARRRRLPPPAAS